MVSWDKAIGGASVVNETYMSRQVFPQAPSPTITSLRRISAMVKRLGGQSDERKERRCVETRSVALEDYVSRRVKDG